LIFLIDPYSLPLIAFASFLSPLLIGKDRKAFPINLRLENQSESVPVAPAIGKGVDTM
jgi:hypothetical protein